MTPTRLRPSAKAVIVRDGRLLVTRNSSPGDPAGEWHILPGGGQRPGETLADTLRREVLEETGLTVEPVRMLWVRELIVEADSDLRWTMNTDEHPIEFMFEARLIDEGADVTEADDHQIGLDWVEPDRLAEIRFFPESLIGQLCSWMQGGSPGPVYLGNAS